MRASIEAIGSMGSEADATGALRALRKHVTTHDWMDPSGLTARQLLLLWLAIDRAELLLA